MSAPTNTPDELASRWNPLIEANRTDTLFNAVCVASFLARLQLDRSDALFLEETRGCAGPDQLNADETRVLYLLTETLAAALRFELEGRANPEEGES